MTTTRPADVSSVTTRVLLIDDDAELGELLGEYLAREGFVLDGETDGARAVERLAPGGYHLAVLDVMLPGLNGFDVLRAVRASSRIPVLMLTARGDDVDRIVGLEMGADDYLPKPFHLRELLARVKSVLRRVSSRSQEKPAGNRSKARFAGWNLDLSTRELKSPAGSAWLICTSCRR